MPCLLASKCHTHLRAACEQGCCMCRADDVQVEFIMLDPYQRITMQHNNEVCTVPALVWNQSLSEICVLSNLPGTHLEDASMHVCMSICHTPAFPASGTNAGFTRSCGWAPLPCM